MTNESGSSSNEVRVPTAASIGNGVAVISRAPNRSNVGSLSGAQQRIWITQQLDPTSPFYNALAPVELIGKLSIQALTQALCTIVARHEALRTSIHVESGQPVQVVNAQVNFLFQLVDLQDLDPEKREPVARAIVAVDGKRPIDLNQSSMLRTAILKMSTVSHLLHLVVHHIVFDGYSGMIVVAELQRLYEALCSGRALMLPSPAAQYLDFTLWQRELLTSKYQRKLLEYWQQTLEDSQGGTLLELPVDGPRNASPSFDGDVYRWTIAPDIADKLRQLGRSQKATLFSVLLSSFYVLISRYARTKDVIIATPVANRRTVESQEMIGCFVNLLPVRVNLSDDLTFVEVLRQVQNTVLDTLAHEDMPFERLVEEFDAERAQQITRLSQVVFTLQSPVCDLKLQGGELQMRLWDAHTRTTKFDLYLSVSPKPQGLVAAFEYDNKLFDVETIRRMAESYSVVLENVVKAPEKPIWLFPIQSDMREKCILERWSNAGEPDDRIEESRAYHQSVEMVAECSPDALAVVFEETTLTYRQLNEWANRLARQLQAVGVKQGSRCAIYLNRSVDAVVAILAISKSGAAYVPIDTLNPIGRVTWICSNAEVDAIVSSRDFAQKLQGIQRQLVFVEGAQAPRGDSTNLDLAVQGSDLFYVIYTSGSTGSPKGVMVEHASVNNLIEGLRSLVYDELGTNPLRVSLNASLSFDASVQQLLALTLGHCLYILPDEVRGDGDLLHEYLQRWRLDVFDCTPSHLHLLSRVGRLNPDRRLPRVMLVGGEPINEDQWIELASLKHVRAINVYGPTECTVDAIAALVEGDVPVIGRPLNGVGTYILDSHGRPAPQGVVGELYLSGRCLARGYLRLPELTAERFVHASWLTSNMRLFRTGDMARFLKDGVIEFCSRNDDQVKINGYRVELGEIQALLEHQPDVQRAAIVKVDASRGPRLWQTESSDTTKDGLNSHQLLSTIRQVPGVASAVMRVRSQYRPTFPELTPFVCKRCVNSAADSRITFDADGVCSVCRLYESQKSNINRYFSKIEDLRHLIGDRRDVNGSFDCMLLFSGGKDSTYALYRLVEMGLRVLAFTFDNGFLSPSAMENIRSVTRELDVEHIIENVQRMPEVFRESLTNDSSVCTGCFRSITAVSTKLALDRNIGVVITGLSRAQIIDTKLQQFVEQGVVDLTAIESGLKEFRRAYHAQGGVTSDVLSDTYLSIDPRLDAIAFVDFFRYCSDGEEEILRHLRTRNDRWRRPVDTGLCSTNCLINDVGTFVHLRDRGFHNYMSPLSWEVRLGYITRDAALVKLNCNVDSTRANKILVGLDAGTRAKPSIRSVLEVFIVRSKNAVDEDVISATRRVVEGFGSAAEIRLVEQIPWTDRGEVIWSQMLGGGVTAWRQQQLIAYVAPHVIHSAEARREKERRLQHDRVNAWRLVHDAVVTNESGESDTVGWVSSTTGDDIPKEEMLDWIKQKIDRIRSLGPRHVLEIGAGTGLLLSELIHDCKTYLGTDFSPSTIRHLQSKKLDQFTPGCELRVECRDADDFRGLVENQFDTVIINSVVQYFPSDDYLRRVLEGAVAVTKPGGRIFIGDVRNLDLLNMFHAVVTVANADPLALREEARRRAHNHVVEEEELVISPRWFKQLSHVLNRIAGVRVLLTPGSAQNELTLFRYDVVLELDTPAGRQSSRLLKWGDGVNSLEEIEDALRGKRSGVRIVSVPNKRLSWANYVRSWLERADAPATVGEVMSLRDKWEASNNSLGVDPHDVELLARSLGIKVDLTWSTAKPGEFDGAFDVVCPSESARLLELVDKNDDAPMINDPLQGLARRELTSSLRKICEQSLPSYMVPSQFIVIDDIPLTRSGKLDIRRLPSGCLDQTQSNARKSVPPRTPLERELASIWCRVVGADRIGLFDNFFEVGGHSLLATQVISEIRQKFDVELPLRKIFESPTISELSAIVEAEIGDVHKV